jgi:UDPglucose 6-dehydrogenase
MKYPDMQLLGCESVDDYNLVSSVLTTLTENRAPISSMNIFEAEIVKLAVNNFVTMKISFINSIMDACANSESARIKTISDAIGLDSRIGRKYLSGGAPYGGPCFPRDTRALALYLETVGVDSSLARATASVNLSHTHELAKRIMKQLKDGDSKVLLIGASYKPSTNVIEESPAVAIGSILEANGVEVEIWNPIQTLEVNKKRVLCGLEELKFAVSTNNLIVLMRDVSDCTIEEQTVISGAENRFSVWPQN